MIATALEHNGAVVYIASRRLDVLEKASKEHNVCASYIFDRTNTHSYHGISRT